MERTGATEVLRGETGRLTFRQYIALAKECRIRIRSYFRAPEPPRYFAQVEGKESGALICYLVFDPGREEWVVWPDSEPTPILEDLFGRPS